MSTSACDILCKQVNTPYGEIQSLIRVDLVLESMYTYYIENLLLP